MINVDKKTGEAIWYVSLSVRYRSTVARNYSTVNFEGGKTVSVNRASGNVLSCDHNCDYLESYYVKLDPEDIQIGIAKGLKMRWNSQNIGTFVVDISVAYLGAMKTATL